MSSQLYKSFQLMPAWSPGRSVKIALASWAAALAPEKPWASPPLHLHLSLHFFAPLNKKLNPNLSHNLNLLMPLSLLLAGLILASTGAALGNPALTLPPELEPLRKALERHGFRVLLQPPPRAGNYGLFESGSKRLWIAPVSFDLGIGRHTFLHEAAHAAQSCPAGKLTPIGWRLPLNPVVAQEIQGITTKHYHFNTWLLEREAFAVQGQPNAMALIIRALDQRCLPIKARPPGPTTARAGR
jgi:hypothetical protein